MEDLNKHQLILLTLLVSFVTSIATGVITFTLLQEAPVEVTNTINRVVEKTIEQVAPSDGNKTTVKEIQVINEEDLVLKSIEKNIKSLVRVKTLAADGSQIVSGLGIVISDKGDILMDSRSYNPSAANYILFTDGKSYSTDKVYTDEATGLVFTKLSMNGHANEKTTFTPATFGNSDGLKLGQTIIDIAGREGNSVNIGRVSELSYTDDKKTVKKIISNIKSPDYLQGIPLLNTAGEIVGLESQAASVDAFLTFTPINSIKASITKAISELSK